MNVKGFLIDLDGVLYTGDHPVPGAAGTIEFLKEHHYSLRFVSNTTRKCRAAIADRLAKMGFDIPAGHIFTPAQAAAGYMKKSGHKTCHLLTTGDVYKDFSQVIISDTDAGADCVIVGDAGDCITYGSLNTAFRHIIGGAELIALEKDRYWMAPDGLSLSAGPFVAALEFATGKTAAIMGKPSREFFSLALRDMGLQPGEAAMIGDDILTDIRGCGSIGMNGILVRTGKYHKDAVTETGIRPAYIIDSIAHLGEIL
jgi:HAD superfamily hydrolase (TIGR01458 family)